MASAHVYNLILPPLPPHPSRWPLAVCPTHQACVLLCTCCSLCLAPSSTELCWAPSSSSWHRPPPDVSSFPPEFTVRPPLPPRDAASPRAEPSRRDSTRGPGIREGPASGKAARQAAEGGAGRPRSPPQRELGGPGALHAEGRRVRLEPGAPAQPQLSPPPGARRQPAARTLTPATAAPGGDPLAGNARTGAALPGVFPPEAAGSEVGGAGGRGGGAEGVGGSSRHCPPRSHVQSVGSPSSPALGALVDVCTSGPRSATPVLTAEPYAPWAPRKIVTINF